MNKTRITDNINENSASNTMDWKNRLDHAEATLKEQFFSSLPDEGPFESERVRRVKAFNTLQSLIDKERNAPVGTELERLTELAKGIHSGYIVFLPLKVGKNRVQVEFFHTIRREIIGNIVFERKDGYFRIKSMMFDAF